VSAPPESFVEIDGATSSSLPCAACSATGFMLVELQTDDLERLRRLIWRIEGRYWEGNHLIVTPLHF
jgi:hypothetical protein